MAFIHKSDGHLPPKPVSDSQPIQRPRFRPAVIAVIAAKRLVHWSAASCCLCTVHGSLPLGPATSVLCIGCVPSCNSCQCVDGMSQLGTCESFFCVRIESRIESAVRFDFKSNFRMESAVYTTQLFTLYSEYLIHSSVFPNLNTLVLSAWACGQ